MGSVSVFTNVSVIAIGLCLVNLCTGIDLEFQRYHFRKKSTWGRAVNRIEYSCREEECQNIKESLQKDICIRKCISPGCYRELYAWNELEEGERDIRWTSFKGCAAEELRKTESTNKYLSSYYLCQYSRRKEDHRKKPMS